MTRQSVAHMPVSFEVTDETTGVTTSTRENCLWTKCMHNVRKLLVVLRENPELTEEATGLFPLPCRFCIVCVCVCMCVCVIFIYIQIYYIYYTCTHTCAFVCVCVFV